MKQPHDILLAEDDAEDAELILGALGSVQRPNSAYWVKDGAETVDFIKGEGAFAERRRLPKPKIILLDIKMPRMSGLEALAILKSDPMTSFVPVVMLTSSRAERDVVESYKLGANSYVVKPVDFDHLTRTICQLADYWLSLNTCLQEAALR